METEAVDGHGCGRGRGRAHQDLSLENLSFREEADRSDERDDTRYARTLARGGGSERGGMEKR